MLIRCPTCASAYELEPDLVPAGRILRCAHCRDAWVHAAPPPDRRADGREIAAQARFSRPDAAAAVPKSRPRGRIGRLRPLSPAGAAAAIASLALLGGGWAAVAGRAGPLTAFPGGSAFAALDALPNPPGLSLAADRSTVEPRDGVPTLTVEGRIANLRPGPAPVPDLRIAVRDKAGRELYQWIAPAPKPRLGAGEVVSFQGRLASPPPGGRDLAVSFSDAPAEPRRLAEMLPGDR